MRCGKHNRPTTGFTMVEMLVVIAIIGILAALLLPALNGGKQRALRIVCENQLQQIGLGFQSFSHDHNSKFPAQVSTNDGGALEFITLDEATGYAGYRNFQSLAGTLQTPRILVCPADTRTPAPDFAGLTNANLSYFAATSARYDQPLSVLAGDGNLASSAPILHGAAGGRLTWNAHQHRFKGNVLFADGHVEEWSDTGGMTLGGDVTLDLPATGGGNHGPSPAMRLSDASSPPADTNSSPSTNQLTAPGEGGQATPTPSDSAAPIGPTPGSPKVNLRGTLNRTASGTSPAENSSIVVEGSTQSTSAPIAAAAASADEEILMSPANREVAGILRELLAGTYLLVLLVLLLYAAYRYYRWKQKQAARTHSED